MPFPLGRVIAPPAVASPNRYEHEPWDAAAARQRYFNLLMRVAERLADTGMPETDLLDRIERWLVTTAT
ncbi:MAG: hypothetical protein ACYDB4_17540 [Candidatus Dormibacteraceae bacterium]